MFCCCRYDIWSRKVWWQLQKSERWWNDKLRKWMVEQIARAWTSVHLQVCVDRFGAAMGSSMQTATFPSFFYLFCRWTECSRSVESEWVIAAAWMRKEVCASVKKILTTCWTWKRQHEGVCSKWGAAERMKMGGIKCLFDLCLQEAATCLQLLVAIKDRVWEPRVKSDCPQKKLENFSCNKNEPCRQQI